MLLTKKNLALSLVALVLLSFGAIGMHLRHHVHRHGFSRGCCSSCAEISDIRHAATRRIFVFIPPLRGPVSEVIPASEACQTTNYKSIFSIRPPPAG